MSFLAKQLIKKEKQGRTGKLDLGRCGLTDLENQVPELFDCFWLEELTLSNNWSDRGKRKEVRSKNNGGINKISALPPTLPQLSQLRVLRIGGATLFQWQIRNTHFLEKLTALQFLDLSCNQITDVRFLEKLTALQFLDLSYNQISDYGFLGKLTVLQSIYLHNNQIMDACFLENLTSLQCLDLSYNQIKDTRFLEKLTGLTTLDLSYNQISDTHFLEKLTGLTTLDLSYNQISDTRFLEKTTGLTTLDLSSNQISDTRFLEKLTALTSLYVDNNKISDLRFLRNLTCLQKLRLRGNRITEPKFLDYLTNLKILYLSKNQISNIEPLLPLIKKGIPVKMAQEHKEGINLLNNPLTVPPPEVVKKGNEAILRYFEELETQGEEIVYEAKMLILGDAGAGKTSLARKIEDPDAPMPEEVKDSTPGIAVKSLLLNEREPNFTMHIWDFGGQEVYHATHQFFLSKRSLYVLLADGRKEEQLDYWLQMQEIYGLDSRLLLVVNQKGEMQPNLPMSDIRRDFPNVQEAQPTILNLKTDRIGAFALRQRIEHTIRNLPQFEQGLRTPKIWAAIRRQLEAIPEDHISLKEFRSICEKEGIGDRTRQEYLLEFLHNLGAVLHFYEVAGLNKLVILNPTWATEAVYRLLDHTKNKGSNGHFTKKDLDAVWQCAEYEEYFAELLLLMERFELCYEAPEQRGLYIVPSLLSDDRPANSDWKEEPNEMQLWYEYSFMPKGIVTRLIVRQHHLLEKPPTVWKRGAVFTLDDAKAEVTESFREKRISIRAKGKQAKTLLTLLARDIDALNSGFHFNERMTLKQVVPCNCVQCKNSGRPHPFDYKTLENRLLRGRTSIDCEVSLEPISILDLLRETFADADVFLNRILPGMHKVRVDGKNKMSQIIHIDEKKGNRTIKYILAPLKVFISYSKYDREKFLVPMTRYLKPLMIGGLLETWDDSQILPGEEWDETIKEEIAKADVIFLLVSNNSLNTDYIWNVEIKDAMKWHEKGKRVVPIILSQCLWTEKDGMGNYIFPPAKLNALPNKGRPVDEFERENQAWQAVADGIKAILKTRA